MNSKILTALLIFFALSGFNANAEGTSCSDVFKNGNLGDRVVQLNEALDVVPRNNYELPPGKWEEFAAIVDATIVTNEPMRDLLWETAQMYRGVKINLMMREIGKPVDRADLTPIERVERIRDLMLETIIQLSPDATPPPVFKKANGIIFSLTGETSPAEFQKLEAIFKSISNDAAKEAASGKAVMTVHRSRVIELSDTLKMIMANHGIQNLNGFDQIDLFN
jgi:hypothetical protein